jgi:hypothetical protein
MPALNVEPELGKGFGMARKGAADAGITQIIRFFLSNIFLQPFNLAEVATSIFLKYNTTFYNFGKNNRKNVFFPKAG